MRIEIEILKKERGKRYAVVMGNDCMAIFSDIASAKREAEALRLIFANRGPKAQSPSFVERLFSVAMPCPRCEGQGCLSCGMTGLIPQRDTR